MTNGLSCRASSGSGHCAAEAAHARLDFDDNGAPWIVDDGLLAVADDLIERLQKWLEEDTEI